jgi:hypothetical protein
MRTTLIAVAVTLSCAVVVVTRVSAAPGPPPSRAATPEQRVEAANEMAAKERAWENETAQNFPSDHWSQRDDFHGREFHAAIETARAKGIPVEEVLRAVDDDIHRARVQVPNAPDLRDARAIPCKPRPFYD